MKYYVGYYNEPWDKSKFTVVCGCPSLGAAQFIQNQYIKESGNTLYLILTAAESMDKTLIF